MVRLVPTVWDEARGPRGRSSIELIGHAWRATPGPFDTRFVGAGAPATQGMATAAAEQAVGVLHTFLQDHRDSIQERWLDLIFSGFPAKGHEFLCTETNQFHNPIGHTLREETAAILQRLIAGAPTEDMAPSLERIVKIRAVQDCLPSEATAFVFHLKTAVRDTLEAQNQSYPELAELEKIIDRLACDAFDHYMMCKQKIFEIGARAEKMRVAKLLERLDKRRDTTDNTDPFTA